MILYVVGGILPMSNKDLFIYLTITQEYLFFSFLANFSQKDLPDPPVIECDLNPGDLLYLPRGYIHQGQAFPHTHSLHLTLSVCQRNTWGDLLRKVRYIRSLAPLLLMDAF